VTARLAHIDITAHKIQTVEGAVAIRLQLVQGIRVLQRGQIGFPALGDEPAPKVHESVVAAAVQHDGGGGPEAVFV